MKRLLTVVTIALSICYPFLVYWGLQRYDAKLLLPILLILLAMRWFVIGARTERKVVLATLLAVMCIVFVWGNDLGLKFYPVMMNVGFLVLFGSSLFSSVTFVERLARIREPDLPPKAVIYTRKVTRAWSLFFLFNGTIAAITALWASDEIWMLYNGMIAYLLMGLLAGGEWIIRQRVKRD